MKFGENLQKLRKEKGISQEQLAEQLGVTRQSVSKWESGSSYPEMDKIVTLCHIFDCDLDVLVNKDISEERQRKDASGVVKNIFVNISTYIKKTIYLFEHKSLKELIKMGAQIFIIFCMILLIAIPFMVLKEIVIDLFYTGDNVISIFFARFWNFLFDITYIIVAVSLFVYIFKVKFLDGEEIIIEEVSDEAFLNDNDNQETAISSLKGKVKTVVKIRKKDGFSLLDLLAKIVSVCMKGILLICFIPMTIWIVLLVIGLVLCVILIFQGLVLAGPILLLLGVMIFSIVVLEIALNFIFNLKFSKRRIIMMILSSIVIAAIGLGLSIWFILNLTVIDGMPKEFEKTSEEKVYMMSDNLTIHPNYMSDVEYIEDENYQDKVLVEITYYRDNGEISLKRDQDDVYLYYSEQTSVDIQKITRNVIDNLKENKMYSYDFDRVSMRITSSKENIEKIQNNMFE